jgi:hypothetical protein
VLCLGRPAAGDNEVFRRKDSYRRTKDRYCTGTRVHACGPLLGAPLTGDARDG